MPDTSLASESWRVLRITGEFVDAIDTLCKLPPAVSVFGSARLPEDNEHYKSAQECGKLLVEAGFAVITGGGPGIMEATNRGVLIPLIMRRVGADPARASAIFLVMVTGAVSFTSLLGFATFAVHWLQGN